MDNCTECNQHDFPIVNGICEGCKTSATYICAACERRRYRRDGYSSGGNPKFMWCKVCHNYSAKGYERCAYRKMYKVHQPHDPQSHDPQWLKIYHCPQWLKRDEVLCPKHSHMIPGLRYIKVKEKNGILVQSDCFVRD